MAKISTNDISYMSQDWGKDPSNGLPYSGQAIQKFIKQQFGSKIGILHYDSSNNRYLAFADADSRDAYIADPTQTGLILGTFDAPFNYSAEINLISDSYVAIPVGTTGNYIEFEFDIKNKNGASVGEDVICTYTIFRGSVKKTITQKYRSGTTVRFNVDAYLGEGSNRINIGIVGQNTLAATTISVTYQVVNLVLTDDTNISTVYDLANSSKVLSIPFTVSGYGTKTVEWYLDGTKLEFEKNVDEVVDATSTRTKYITLSNLARGTHYVEFRAYTIVDGEKFYSRVLHRDIIIENSGIADKTPIIALSYEKEDPKDTTVSLSQYLAYDLVFAIHNPYNPVSTEVGIFLGETKVTTLSVQNGLVNTYSVVPTETGKTAIKVVALEKEYTLDVFVTENSMGIGEITADLELGFSAVGRSNIEHGKETWEGNGHTATLTGFNFTQTSGWVNNKLLLQSGATITFDYAPLANGSTAVGRTLEFEFASSNVSDDTAVLCDLTGSNGSGIVITASEAKIVSRGGVTLSVKYKSEENTRITFVVNRATNATNKGLVFIYVNGVVSGAINFSASDDFISDTVLAFNGTSKSEILLKQVRVYNTALSSDQILNNFILYRDTTEEMLEVFDRNDIYEEGTVNLSVDKLQGQLPVMVVTGDIPTLENTTNKNTQITVDIEYYNLQDPTKSFTMKNAAMRPQGTSSMLYPKKNFRIYTQKLDSTVLTVNGDVVENKLYSFVNGAQPVNCWCLKADFAESSGTHNTGIARLWNDLLVNSTIDGEYVFRTEAQKKAIENGYNYDVRTTIDGFPILLFYRRDENSELIFIGKYNFNNDKSTESVFGFKGIPGFDNSRMQCWEILNNGDALALFTNVSDFDSRWRDAYESRYPDTKNPNTEDLKAFSVWIDGVKNNPTAFATQKWEHLQVYLMAAYYVYLMRFGAVDQVVKNAMFTSEDGVHFYYINYDNDTINGLRNNGILAFDPTIDRQSLDPATGGLAYAYAGHDSVLWNLLEGDSEFMEIVKQVDNALYTSGLRYDNVIRYFDNEQSNKWNERVYNQDAQYKYIGPYTDSGNNNLLMLQGKRQSHRRWWLSRRFSLYDSKFVSGDFKGKALEFKVINNTEPGWSFTIKAGTEMEYGYGVYNPVETGISLNEGESHSFTIQQTLNIGDPVRIYSAVNLMSVDLSNILPRLSNVELNNVWNEALGSKLKELILGNGTSTNEILTSVSSIAKAKRLEKLDIRGCKNITSMDLTELLYLKTFLAKGSGLTGLELAKGAGVTSLSLPRTMQVLRFEELTSLTATGLELEGNGVNVYSMSIINCPNLSRSIDVPVSWLNNKTTEDIDCTLYIDNIVWTNVEPSLFLKICSAKTNGANVTLKGQVKLTSSSQEIIDAITKAFGSEVFTPTNELYVNAPDSVFLSGPSTVVEGDTAKYDAVVFSEYRGTVKFSIVNNSRSGVSIDADTGLLTTTENGYSDSTLSVRAIHIPTQGVAVHSDKEITIKKRIYPSNVTINGNANLNVELNKFSWSCSDSGVTGEVRTEWVLSGTITGYAEMYSQDGNTCVVKKTLDSIETIEGTLTARLYSVTTGALKKTVMKAITVLNPDIIMTKVTNPEVLAIMYANGLCANENYMTRNEAASVADIQFNSGTTASTSIFYNKGIKYFDELEYFTGLTSIPPYCFYGCRLTNIKFPPNITSIGKMAFANSDNYANYFEEFNIPEGVADIGEKLFVDNSYYFEHLMPDGFQMRLSLPSTLKTIGNSAFSSVPIASISGFSEGLISIGKYAFTGYTGTVLSLPNSLTTLGEGAFENTNLTEFTVPSGVTEVTENCIGGKDCTMYVHAGVTKITNVQLMIKAIVVDSGNATFRNYNGIVMDSSNYAVNVPAYLDVEEFSLDGISGFRGSNYVDGYYETCCAYLMNVKKLIIGGTWRPSLFSGTFRGMPSLEEIDLSGNTNFTLKDGHLFSADGTTLCKLVKADSYTIPNEVTDIWLQKYGNVNDLVVPDNGLSIPYTFKYYRGNKITIKGTHRMQDAFMYADGLKVVDLSECINGGDIGNLFVDSSVEEVILSKDFVFDYYTPFDGSKLRTITFPEEITQPRQISLLFDNLEYLEYVDIPSNFTKMPSFDGCVNLKTIICRIVTAPRTSEYNDYLFGAESKKYTGMNTKNTGENILYVPAEATGYDTGEYQRTLCNPDRCGFTLSATL